MGEGERAPSGGPREASGAFCAELSRAGGEPLAGTAVSAIDRFLVVEHAHPWGPKGVEDSGLPASVVDYLAQLSARHLRLRVQLARKADVAPRREVRVLFAETGEGPGTLAVATLQSVEALPSLPIDGWLGGVSAAPGQPHAGPVYLVCVHGKRDRCCALYGLPVYRGLSTLAGEQVLQTTHLGGHRFAATLLVLPTGLCYGRVEPAEVDALHQATLRGELYELARLRGRTSYASEAQAAEIALRRELGDRAVHSLRLLGSTVQGPDTYAVRFAEVASGREHEVIVERQKRAPSPASCGAPAKPSAQLVPLRVSAAG